MRIGVLNTAFVGDLALMARLVDALYRDQHEVILFSNGAGCSLYSADERLSKRVVVKKAHGLKKMQAVLEIARQIRDENLDILLVAHKSLTSGLIGLLSGAPRRITFSDSSLSWAMQSPSPRPGMTHESERYLSLAQGCVSEAAFKAARLEIRGDRSLPRFLQANPGFFTAGSGPFFVCSPGSVWETKKYPAHLLAGALARILSERMDLRCVLSGGPADAETIQDVINWIRESSQFSNVSSRLIDARACLPLPELIELTRRALFVVTPDSAPLHIASATGTQTFAFFGPTSSTTGFGPLAPRSYVLDYNNLRGQPLDCQPCSKHGHKVCPQGHHRCLADLPPDAVAVRVLESAEVES